MFDLISIGDVTEDVFIEVTSAHLDYAHHQQSSELCMPFGTKLAIERVDKLLGGNAGNVAIGSSRLGLRSALYAEVGDDSQGKLLLHSLTENKVSTKYFYHKKGEKTNYSVVLDYGADRTILVHHEPRKYHFPKLESTRWVYFTSMGKGSEKIISPLLQYLHKIKAHLAFNPGTYQLGLGIAKVKPLLQLCTILFLNTEEAQQITKTKERHFPHLLQKLYAFGPEIVVITDGRKGSYCYDGHDFYFCPIYKVPILEMTGAGDAFATGFICALQYGHTLPEALRWGSINAAGVIQRIGPQEGLVHLPLLKKILAANLQFQPKAFQDKEVRRNTTYVPKHYTGF